MSLTGIVLAGGRSTRFGSDKLAEPFEGSTVLGTVIDVLSTLVDGVLVAGSDLPRDVTAADVPVALVRDPEPFAGPLAALAHVLATYAGGVGGAGDAADADADDADGADELAIIVGGDMPRLQPAVLRAMVATLAERRGIDAVWLGRHDAAIDAKVDEPPTRQVLPLAIRVQPASRAAREAVEAGQRSLQALLDRMTAIELPWSAWRVLDPEGLTLLDVDTPEDLDRLRTR